MDRSNTPADSVSAPDPAWVPRYAYVTMVTSDSYLSGAIALAKSSRKHRCRYPLHVIVGSGVSLGGRKSLGRYYASVIVVPTIPASSPSNTHADNTNASPARRASLGASARLTAVLPSSGDVDLEADGATVFHWSQSEYTKLNVWNLTQFDKIVYVDCDAILADNTDELFDLDVRFAAAPDVFPPDRFNAGVMVVRPDAAVFESLRSRIGEVSSYDQGDTGFLNACFPDWYSGSAASRLPFKYNAQRTMHWLTYSKNPGYWEAIQPIKILHFSSSPKPWQKDRDSFRKGDLEWLWWDVFMELSEL